MYTIEHLGRLHAAAKPELLDEAESRVIHAEVTIGEVCHAFENGIVFGYTFGETYDLAKARGLVGEP